MDSVNIIDKYKISPIQNELDTRILAFLYFKGKCGNNELSDLKIHPTELNRHLLRLYNSQFVIRVSGDNWKCSEKAVSVLEALEFGNLAVEVILDSLDIDENDKLFLTAVLESIYKRTSGVFPTISLQSLLFFIHCYDESLLKDRKFLTDAVYALIIGPNQALSGLGGEQFVSSVFDWHKQTTSSKWLLICDGLAESKYLLISSCENSVRNYKNSNLLIYGHQSNTDLLSFGLACSRIFCWTEDRYLDDELTNFFASREQGLADITNLLIVSKWSQAKSSFMKYLEERLKESVKEDQLDQIMVTDTQYSFLQKLKNHLKLNK